MEPLAVGMSREEIREVALYYGSLSVPQATPSTPTSELAITRGATIAREGIPSARVPICSQCHGPGDDQRNPVYPTLAGQYADYLMLQLQLMAGNRRGGSDFAALMHPIADRLTEEQMRDVGLYYESLTAPPTR